MKGPDADSGWSVFLRINYAAGRYEFGVSDENGDRFAAFPIPACDRSKWFHLTGVHDGAQWKLYHNGILVASEPDPIGAIPVAADWIQSDDFLVHSQLRGGGTLFSVAPSASAYSRPVTLDESMEINARIFHDGEWGPLATVDYQTPNLAITKIHYDPDVDPEVDLFPASAYEFIEIQTLIIGPLASTASISAER